MTLVTKPVFFSRCSEVFYVFNSISNQNRGRVTTIPTALQGRRPRRPSPTLMALDLRHSRAGHLGAPSHDACRKRGENVCCFRLFSMSFRFFPKTCSYCSFLLQVGHVHSFFILGCICCNVQYMVWPLDGQPVAGVLSVEDPGYLLGKLEIQ